MDRGGSPSPRLAVEEDGTLPGSTQAQTSRAKSLAPRSTIGIVVRSAGEYGLTVGPYGQPVALRYRQGREALVAVTIRPRLPEAVCRIRCVATNRRSKRPTSSGRLARCSLKMSRRRSRIPQARECHPAECLPGVFGADLEPIPSPFRRPELPLPRLDRPVGRYVSFLPITVAAVHLILMLIVIL